ncbi:unnamed protein product [Rotaria magnacalcarata]|uniref:non-specific serine/threonine protein kinase n=1 Tax=Rotaria magnacalcarata TaxID=392030 RepID=A0A816V502_9BILA|nr:unnamed protein product [Rotaria magnacalcarata]CAF1370716.1 unnamed protein product [Rotaria magnacalcarata]CAF2115793.1 unnamed protein product [Rotaria magnacalcarata]CAF2163062.1 unnamed protein product [Rotaria magnacalcarata]CAF2167159.1 unnamed protein product [Rotaria magnacalcarata]
MGCVCSRQSVVIQGQKFHLIQQIGEGSFSYVFEARNTADSHRYAVKKMSCHTKEEEKRARDEIENYQRFSHTNLVALLYHELIQYRPDAHVTCIAWLVFPYFKNGSLQDALNTQTKFTTRVLLDLFLSVCQGVQEIHEKRMAHRDLKPSNIMLVNNTHGVILDFGSMTPASFSMTTRSQAQQWQDWAEENCCVQYRAPELFHIETNSSITEKTDIFSLGAILYACCFGKGPFDDVYSRGDSVALAIASGRIELPVQSSTYPSDVIDTMLAMLQIDSDRRPSIQDVIDKLSTSSRFTMDII